MLDFQDQIPQILLMRDLSNNKAVNKYSLARIILERLSDKTIMLFHAPAKMMNHILEGQILLNCKCLQRILLGLCSIDTEH